MSSLSLALNSAVSSLLTLQTRMGLVSSNIANANTPGYTTESAVVTPQVNGGIGTGVDIGSISRSVDQILVKQIAAAGSQVGYAATTNSYYQNLIQVMGTVNSTGGGTDLSSSLNSLQTALTNLSNTPTDAALQSGAVSQLDDTTALLRQTSSQVQQLRANADQDITSTTSDINNALDTIGQTNISIARASASGQPTAGLEDQRQTALQTLTNDLGVNYFINGNNQMVVVAGGQTLVDGLGNVNHLSHTAAGSVTSLNSYNNGTYSGTKFDGIWVRGVDITPQIGDGKLKALIDQRDTVLPGVQTQLDALASNISTTFNNIASTESSPNPVPNSITGTTAVTAGTAVTAAAGTTVQLALVNLSTGVVDQTASVGWSGATTAGQIATDLNTAITAMTPATGSVSVASGKMVLTAPPGYGVAVVTTAGNFSVGGGAATNFSKAFGLNLNNIIVNGTSASSIGVDPTVLNNPSLLGSYQLNNLGTTGSPPFTSTSVGGALSDQMFANQGFTVSGVTTTTTFSGYAGDIISGVASQAQLATTRSDTHTATLQTLQSTFSSEYGVNMDEETAKMTQLQNAYAASAKVISTVQSMFQSLIQAVS